LSLGGSEFKSWLEKKGENKVYFLFLSKFVIRLRRRKVEANTLYNNKFFIYLFFHSLVRESRRSFLAKLKIGILGLRREEEKCKLGTKQRGTTKISGGNVGLRVKEGRSS